MSALEVMVLTPTDPNWPTQLTIRVGSAAPTSLAAMGEISLLAKCKTALFCSVRCPGDAILATQDVARRWRDEGRCIISGFHSSLENEWLQVLLRGKKPITIYPARTINAMRIPTEWCTALEMGCLLFLSPSVEQPKRATRESSARRNEVVAALAAEAFIRYVTPGGETERIAGLLRQWNVLDYVAH